MVLQELDRLLPGYGLNLQSKMKLLVCSIKRISTLLYPPDDESGGYFGSACGPRRPRPRPRRPRPSRWVCERASTYSFDPIVLKFGVGICYGKGTKPIDFGGNPESKMAAGGHFGKKIKTLWFSRHKFVSGNFQQKKIFFFFLPTKILFASGLKKFSGFFFFFFSSFKSKTCFRHFSAKFFFFAYWP